MKLKKMTFANNDEHLGAVPNSITVSMSIEEALWIAIVAGKQRGFSAHSGIYECLTSDVFNKHWDEGVSDARQFFDVATPPIRYDD